MRIGTYDQCPCLRHRGKRIIICGKEIVILSIQCPAKIERFFSRLRKPHVGSAIKKEYEPYVYALFAGASLSNVLRRIKEDGLL